MPDIDSLLEAFQKELEACSQKADALNVKAKYLGKQGTLTTILKHHKTSSSQEKQQLGPQANRAKEVILGSVQEKLHTLDLQEIHQKLEKKKQDITWLDDIREGGAKHGGYHPRNLVQRELEDICLSMGFAILHGPYIEDEFYNFEALNIPQDHPARDMQDTFWFHGPTHNGQKHLLRTHTSSVQVRAMQKNPPPFKFISPGMVFRCERTDAGHEMAFNQLEGVMIDRNLGLRHLIYFVKTFLREVFQKEVKTRLRPGFFPFVEPGLELDIACLICKGKGCPVCKQSGWVELLPCGMIHPHVLTAGHIDPEAWSGFAFGLGLDRLVMMKYGIDDIRLFHTGDLRFNQSFKAY